MKRTPLAALTLATAALVLTGCAEGEPQAAETVTVTANPTPSDSPTPVAETKVASPSPTDAGFTFTPNVDTAAASETLLFMARWLPDDEVTTTPVDGVVTVLVDGSPMQVDMEATLPARPAGIDYYMAGFTVEAGSEVGMRVSVLDDALPGTLECTISVEGAGEPLVREISTEFQDTGVPIAECDGIVP